MAEDQPIDKFFEKGFDLFLDPNFKINSKKYESKMLKVRFSAPKP